MAPAKGQRKKTQTTVKGAAKKEADQRKRVAKQVSKRTADLGQHHHLRGSYIHNFRVPGWRPNTKAKTQRTDIREIEKAIVDAILDGEEEVTLVPMNTAVEQRSGWIEFPRDGPIACVIDNLAGCSVIAAVCRRGMMVQHLWEGQKENKHLDIMNVGNSLHLGRGRKPVQYYLQRAEDDLREHIGDFDAAKAGKKAKLILPLWAIGQDAAEYRYDMTPWEYYDIRGRVDSNRPPRLEKGLPDMIRDALERGSGMQAEEHTYSPLDLGDEEVEERLTTHPLDGTFVVLYERPLDKKGNPGNRVSMYLEGRLLTNQPIVW